MTQLTTKLALTALIGAGLVIGSIAEAAPKSGGKLLPKVPRFNDAPSPFTEQKKY